MGQLQDCFSAIYNQLRRRRLLHLSGGRINGQPVGIGALKRMSRCRHRRRFSELQLSICVHWQNKDTLKVLDGCVSPLKLAARLLPASLRIQ